MDTQKNFGKWFLIATVLAVTFFVPLPEAKRGTMAAVGLSPFGGIIVYAAPCTCSTPNWGIKVGPPVGGSFIYSPGSSDLRAWYNLFHPGPWVLGIAQGYAPCMQQDYPSCTPDKVVAGGPVMIIVGTSK